MDLKETYFKKIVPQLMQVLKLKNALSVPRVSKIQLNVGIGTYLQGGKDFEPVVENIAQIAGQKPVVTKARTAISNFKLREEMPNGVTVTLRGQRMYDFLNKLINIVLPRLRDFRGLSRKSFDGNGNYSIGMREFTVFPEIHPDDVVKMHGVQVVIVTTAKDDEAAYKLLKAMNFPFKKDRDLAQEEAEKAPVKRAPVPIPEEKPAEEAATEEAPTAEAETTPAKPEKTEPAVEAEAVPAKPEAETKAKTTPAEESKPDQPETPPEK